jgi:hypothetical protein
MYPTLFPYRIGGFEDSSRSLPLSMKQHVKHLLNLSDNRFQEHNSFLFTAFNMIQRCSVLVQTSWKVKRDSYQKVAQDLASVSVETVHIVSERISRGDYTANTDEERTVMKLMKEVNIITANVPGTSVSKMTMRNEIRALMTDHGLPSFYITINPVDVYNPIVRFLSGEEIDIDRFLPFKSSDYWQQSTLVAKNPMIAAKFFN